jgi:hypothetical protein
LDLGAKAARENARISFQDPHEAIAEDGWNDPGNYYDIVLEPVTSGDVLH